MKNVDYKLIGVFFISLVIELVFVYDLSNNKLVERVMTMIQLEKLYEIRTNNFKDTQMAAKFDQLWNEASKNVENGEVLYGVYSDYASNYMGDYTVGAYRESEKNDLKIDVLTNYKTYEVNSTDPIGVFNTWQKIWSEEEASEIRRAYTYDFEKYEVDGSISIHIAIQ